jgi:hypothetical protein
VLNSRWLLYVVSTVAALEWTVLPVLVMDSMTPAVVLYAISNATNQAWLSARPLVMQHPDHTSESGMAAGQAGRRSCSIKQMVFGLCTMNELFGNIGIKLESTE